MGDNAEAEEDAPEAKGVPPWEVCPSCMQLKRLYYTCEGCHDITYCDIECAIHDYEVHALICESLKACMDEDRPSEDHRRAILFHHNGNISFEWIKVEGYQYETAPIFGDIFVDGRLYDSGSAGLSCHIHSQEITVFSPADALGEPSNKAIAGLSPLPILFDARGHYLAVGEDGDLNSCDFRALVDWFGSLDYNMAILDPSRFHGPHMSGLLLTTPLPHPDGRHFYPNEVFVRFSPSMFFLSLRVPQAPRLRLVEDVMHICYVERIQVWDRTETYVPLWLHALEMDLSGRGGVPRTWFEDADILPRPGSMVYVRADGKPLTRGHLVVLGMFVKEQFELAIDGDGYVRGERLRGALNRPAFDQFVKDPERNLLGEDSPRFPRRRGN